MQDKLGRTLFCPFGIFGKCYVVPTQEKRTEIVRFNRRFGTIGTLATLVTLNVYGAVYGFALCALIVVAFLLKYRHWQSEMIVCDPALVPRFGEIHPAGGDRMEKVRLAALLAIFILAFGCAAILVEKVGIVASLGVLVLSGVGIVTFGFKLWLVSQK
jgi:hypothetical protein